MRHFLFYMQIDECILMDITPDGIVVRQSEVGQFLFLKFENPEQARPLKESVLYDIEFDIWSNLYKGKYYHNILLTSITPSNSNFL